MIKLNVTTIESTKIQKNHHRHSKKQQKKVKVRNFISSQMKQRNNFLKSRFSRLKSRKNLLKSRKKKNITKAQSEIISYLCTLIREN